MRTFLVFLGFVSLVLAFDENQIGGNHKVEVIEIINTENPAKESNLPARERNLKEENVKDLGTLSHHKPKTLSKVIEAKGSGANEQEALNNALIMALSQLKGVGGENLRQEFKSVKFDVGSIGQIEQSTNEFLQNISKGRIDTYKINAINQTQHGVEVEISAYKYIFENNQKAKLVLYDLSRTTLSENLKEALSDVFAQSKNFQLLQRDNDYKSENDLLKSEEASSDEIYKLGNVLGADYILEFKILEGQKLQNTISSGEKLSLNIAYKLIFFPTKEVFYSKTLNSKITLSEDIKKQQKALEKIALDFNKELENQLFFSQNDENLNQSKEKSNQNDEKQKSPQNPKATNYKLGEKGGVDLGF